MVIWILWSIFFGLGFTTLVLICFSLTMLKDNSHRFLEEHGKFAEILSVLLTASVAFFFAAVGSSIWNLIFA